MAFFSVILLQFFWWFWDNLRQSRLEGLGKKVTLVFFFFVSSVCAEPLTILKARPFKNPDAFRLKKNSKLLKLSDFSNCSNSADKVQWKSKKGGRNTRLLLSDTLKLATEKKFYKWEVHQLIDKYGVANFVFRRPLRKNRWDSLITKDSKYTRVLDTKRGRKVIAKGNLAPFINRPYFTFLHKDGSRLQYYPGELGKSSIVVELSQTTGRLPSPIQVQSLLCRPLREDEEVPKDGTAVPFQESSEGGSSSAFGRRKRF